MIPEYSFSSQWILARLVGTLVKSSRPALTLHSRESTYMSSLHSSILDYRYAMSTKPTRLSNTTHRYEVRSAEISRLRNQLTALQNGRRYHAYREGAYPFVS